MKNTKTSKRKRSLVYKVKDCRDFDDLFYGRIYGQLNLEEKKKIDRIQSFKNRHLSLLALSMIEELSSISIEEIHHDKGRPIIEGQNVSITHKYPYVGVAVSTEEVGIDIETLRDVDESVISYLGCKDSLSTLIEWTKRESHYKSSLADDFKYMIAIVDHKFILTICHKG